MLAAGLGLLGLGAEALVRGAAGLALRFGIPPLVVGLTVVAFGTSAPETFVSVRAAWAGQADLSLGNVIGSNVLNVLFVLGGAALLTPLRVTEKLVRREVPLMVAASGLAFLLSLDGRIARAEGALLLTLLGAYTFLQIRQTSREDGPPEGGAETRRPAAACLGFVVGGLAALGWGAAWLLEAAVSLARAFGLSELVIGLTIVAAATSLPEAATSLLASYRGQRDIAVGNVVGSNLFNILGVLGLSALLGEEGVAVSPAARHFDFPVMLAAAVACLPIFITGHVINRWEGALFLAYYAAYTAYLVLAALDHDAQEPFGAAMLFFVAPLTAVTLAVALWRHLRRG